LRAVKDPHQPKTLREALVPLALLALVIIPNVLAFVVGHDEAEPLVADPKSCHVSGGNPPPMQNRSCLGLEPKVVLWGDSMAQAWTPLAQAVAGHMKLPVTTLARAGCPPLLGADLPLRSPMEVEHCAASNREAQAYLVTHGADTVIIAARWRNYITGEPNGAPAALARAIRTISPHVHRILVIAPTPEFPAECARPNEACVTTRAEFEADSAAAWTALRALNNPKVRLLEPAQWLCEGERCPAIRKGVPLYTDQAHVSAFTAVEFGRVYLRGP
jgi:hypothetical protein